MEITQTQLDVLGEIGNIGSGHAATSLSILMQRRIDMSVPKVWTASVEQMAEIIEQIDLEQAVVFVKAEGEATGKAVFFFPIESAEVVVRTLLNLKPEEIVDLTDELVQSVLKEVGNIMVSAFLVALTEFSGIAFYPSVPALAIDMAGAALEGILLEDGILDEQVLLIDTHLSGEPKLEGKFLFLPEEGTLIKLLEALGV